MRYKDLENKEYIHNVDAEIKDTTARTGRLKTAVRLHQAGYTIAEAAKKTFNGYDDENDNFMRWQNSVIRYIETIK